MIHNYRLFDEINIVLMIEKKHFFVLSRYNLQIILDLISSTCNYHSDFIITFNEKRILNAVMFHNKDYIITTIELQLYMKSA